MLNPAVSFFILEHQKLVLICCHMSNIQAGVINCTHYTMLSTSCPCGASCFTSFVTTTQRGDTFFSLSSPIFAGGHDGGTKTTVCSVRGLLGCGVYFRQNLSEFGKCSDLFAFCVYYTYEMDYIVCLFFWL